MNAFRTGKQYKDEDAAKEVNGGASAKMNLKESPFVRLFETGVNFLAITRLFLRENTCNSTIYVYILRNST